MTIAYSMHPAPQNFSLPDTFTLDHNKLASEAPFRQTRYSNRLFYTDDRAEFNILTSALLATGDIPQSALKMESPDFKVVLNNSREVYVEVTTAIASSEARADNVISDLSFALSNWLRTNPEAESALRGYALSFQISTPPSEREAVDVLLEMKAFVLNADLTAFSSAKIDKIPATYSRLFQLDAKAICLRQGITFVQVTRGAMSVEPPGEAVNVVYESIDRKRSRATAWPQPLWLIVWITGHYYAPDDMLKNLRLPNDRIAPFERVYVGGGRSVLLIKSVDA